MKYDRLTLLAALLGLSMAPAVFGQVTPRMLGNACAGCHGTKGHSAEPMPVISGLSKEYLAQTMKEYRNGKRPSTIMGRLAKGYADDEIEAMATFFAAQVWMSPDQKVDPALVEKGGKIHAERCETCHRNNGRYSDDQTPRIAGQWRRYLEVVMEEYWRPDRRMPHVFMTVIISRLHSGDLTALAHFYASQR